MTASQKMILAEFIAKTIHGYNVTHVFHVPAIFKRTLVEMEYLGIKRILVHTEKAAAYMADGYARVSKRPGVCMSQSVGAANLAAGLQDPYLGRSPVIAITGEKVPVAKYRNAYQEINHKPIFDPVTKFNARIVCKEQVPQVIRQAFREATSCSPGPVHLDVLGYSGEELELAECDYEVFIDENYSQYPSYRYIPMTEDLRGIAEIIENKNRPVIIAGGGAVKSSADSEILELAETLEIPVATSLNAKGIIPENHPLNIGVVGSYSARSANRVVDEADLVIYIGSQTGERVTNKWMVPIPGKKQIIQVDIDPREIGRNYPKTYGVVGDAKYTIRKLIPLIKNKKKTTWRQIIKDIKNEWKKEIEPLKNSDEMPIRPERLCKEISDIIPNDSILVADTGYSAIWAATMISLNHLNQNFICAAGSLGWAFPASLGAKCAAPNKTVICFTGDGGFWYHMSELETALRHNIKTITIINNNSAFGQCIEPFKRAYGENNGKKEELYKFKKIKFSEFAKEIGCHSVTVESPNEIKEALLRALNSELPAVIDVSTDISITPPKAWAP